MVGTFLSNFARAQRQPVNAWSLSVVIFCLLILGPIAAVMLTAVGNSSGLWEHLYKTVLGRYVANTLALMAGVGVLAIGFGVSSAWVVNRYNFFGRRILEWMLLLPAAIPAYIIAYTYTDFFEYAGPFQGTLRAFMGWTTPSDYFFPEIRSLGGAIFVLSSVLYPYVYLLSRTAFRQIPESLLEVTSLYNRSSFWGLSLPLARPAISAGIALVCMEVISDFGTVEYFSLETLTLGIFNVWIALLLAIGSQKHLNGNDVSCFHFIAYTSTLETRIRRNILFFLVLYII